MQLLPSAQLALDTILQRPTQGIPTFWLNIMEHAHLERLAGVAPGEYRQNHEEVYLASQRAAGVCLLDQYLPDNPLTMGSHGYESADRGATTGAEEIVCDGIVIDSPEAVLAHLEQFEFPRLRQAALSFDEDARVHEILTEEARLQEKFGPSILKAGYGFVSMPGLYYGLYGYANYFMAFALYPEVMEQHFSLQADLYTLNNHAAARAYREGHLPPLYRLDHDLADSRGMLVRVELLDRHWFPHFVRTIAPLLQAGVKLIWHCDGNLMDLVPRLLEVGLHGFQGFQYEDGMDYEQICRLKTREGDRLLIVGGASVTRTLPFGTPADVKRELDWLVAHGPTTGLFLGASSSIAPGVPWQNMATLLEGLQHYRTHGRS